MSPSNLSTTGRPDRATIALIGAGPRGTSILERIGANLRNDGGLRLIDPEKLPLDLHVIDDAEDGAGRIWRTDQPRDLCMNTLAHAVTLFTEPGSTVEGPVSAGPTLYEWCVLALHAAFPSARSGAVVATIPSAHIAAFREFGTRAGLVADYRAELEELLPESHPSRALYGEYLGWCYRRAVALLPAGVRVVRHRSRATGVERGGPGGTEGAPLDELDRLDAHERILLSDGTRLEADAVILATGWMPRIPTASERELERQLADRPDLTWVPPESPVNQDLSRITAGSRTIIRGLGMGFFDTVSLLTVGRGGVFVEDPSAPSGLRYHPSGREPALHATSNRGVPFRAKTLYRALPPSPEQRFLRAVDWSARPRPIDFDREFWPRILADAYYDHAETLSRVRPDAVHGGGDEIRAVILAALDRVIAEGAGSGTGALDDAARLEHPVRTIGAAIATLIPNPDDRLDVLGELQPVRRGFGSPAEFDAWIVDRTARDLGEAELGRRSAVKAGLWSISAARGVASRVGTLGGFDAESRRTGFATLMAVGGMVGSGPPAFRNRQLLALVDAGIVRFIGPQARLEVTAGGFTASSDAVAGSAVTAPALIDAWMHFHDLAETADPLARSLAEAERARPFRVPARNGVEEATGAFAIDFASGRLLGSDGRIDPAVHVVGIPVDEQLHDTIISPMPGTDPPMLRETDRVARSAIRVAAAAHGIDPAHGADPEPATDHRGAVNV